MYIYSNTGAGLLFVQSETRPENIRILAADGKEVSCPVLKTVQEDGHYLTTLDASALEYWSVDTPVLYTLEACGECLRFGHTSLRPFQNKQILLNDAPIFLRGYIRGIAAHDHPNMTGDSDYEAALKNIRQAKKYGFNLVRFHSTIPSEDFVRAADELGLLVHIEIGFAYDYDDDGHKSNLSMNNEKWESTILKFRNHPSLAVFCIGNELHNSGHYPQVRTLYEQGRALAPSKLILDNSGWGEYDRNTADIFCQHIAYFFPYAHHGDMFNIDAPWKFNGSTFDVAQEDSACTEDVCVEVLREATAIRPTLSHEAMHYIDIPDYEALNDKFDTFAARVGEEYLKANNIKKPRYLTELPALIREKGLESYMPDYRRASQHWKQMAVKVFLEKLRLSALCGYEMLQLSDCLKYENKNGFLDFFDDDKNTDPAWLLQVNSDLSLIADMDVPYSYVDEKLHVELYASDFLVQPEIMGTLTVTLDGEQIYKGEKFVLAGGLQRLVKLDIRSKKTGTHTLRAEFVSENVTAVNTWTLWTYPRVSCKALPELAIADSKLKSCLSGGTNKSDVYITDTLNETLLSKLDAGKTAILLYTHGAERNTWQFQGALERFKPCIWDRGSNLGGIVKHPQVADAVGGELFDLNMQPLLEAGHKVNLDAFPCKVTEHVLGVDKPVRDRMKGLIHGIKHFIAEDTLRKFSHLFSLQVGAGQLIVCSFNLSEPENPVVANFLKVLIDSTDVLTAENGISVAEFRTWLQAENDAGIRSEDVMNHFWEIDNKAVEDTLFWEEAQVNLALMENKEG